MTKKATRNMGFTLVELLVVIGIIAVLISVLMPALSRVRDQAQLVQCMSNLRQMGIAVHAYVSDNKGAIPRATNHPNWTPGGPTGGGWTGSGEFTSISGIQWALKPYFGKSLEAGTLTTEYRQWFSCPTQGLDTVSNESKSYLQNSRLCGHIGPPPHTALVYYRISNIKRPDRIFLFYDVYIREPTASLGTGVNAGKSAMDRGVYQYITNHRKQKLFNAVCVDGHVETYDAIEHFNGGGRTNVHSTHTTHLLGYGNDTKKVVYNPAITNPATSNHWPSPYGDVCKICRQ